MVLLHKIQVGETVRILKIDAGKTLEGQLQHMGIREGEVLKVIQNTKGPIIVAKEAMRLALGRGMSQKIWVEVLSNVKRDDVKVSKPARGRI